MKHIVLISILVISCVIQCFAQNDKPVIYITYGVDGPDKIKVIDAQTLDEISSIPIADTPEVIITTPNNRLAFIAHAGRIGVTGISVVDLIQKQLIRTLLPGNEITGIKLGNNGFVYALLGTTQQIGIINTENLQVERMINLPFRPTAIALSIDGNFAYVDSTLASQLIVIDLNSNTIVRSLNNLPTRFASGENSLLFSPDGRFLYSAANGTVTVIDPVRLSIVDVLPGSTFSFNLQVSPDGRILYVADFSGIGFRENLVIVDIQSKTIIKKFDEFGTGVRYIKLSYDGNALYINDISRLGALSILDTKTNSIIAQRFHKESVGAGSFSLGGNFNLGTPPTVQVLSPQPSEIIQRGRPFTIRWNTTSGGFNIANHRVELSLDGGSTFNTIAQNLPAATQEFEFTPTNQTIQSAQIRITSTDIGARSTTVASGIFSIGDRPAGDDQPPTVRFLNPLGGERFNSGDNIMITWSSADNVGVTSQDLALSTDGGSTFSNTIATGLGGSIQSFAFTIPSTLQSPDARLRLIVRDAAGNSAQAITPASFVIQPLPDTQAPVVTISSPMANAVFPAGQPITVNWRSIDNTMVMSQALLLSLDGGVTFQNIATFGADTASFTLNNIAGLEKTTARAQVKITATDTAGNIGEQTATFSIGPVISQASYSKPFLTINGIGFSSAPVGSAQIFINGRSVVATRTNPNENTIITLKGNKKKLGLVRGTNTVQVVIDGISSNTANFTF